MLHLRSDFCPFFFVCTQEISGAGEVINGSVSSACEN
jgi:hypothetical protein